MARTSRTGKDLTAFRYCELILPQPIRPDAHGVHRVLPRPQGRFSIVMNGLAPPREQRDLFPEADEGVNGGRDGDTRG